jgi:hypothetical protein
MNFEDENLKFKLGDRVRISKKHHWAQNALGTISEPPEFAKQLANDRTSWKGWHRYVQGIKGRIEFYWVDFDNPQFDADGDGPYIGGEIRGDAIERLL